MLAFFVYLPKHLIMISISLVYNAVKALANEDQKGFVNPYTFNAMASVAQMNVYNEIMNGSFEASRFTNSRSDVRGTSSKLNSNKQHRSFYISTQLLENDSNNQFLLPVDCNKVVAVYRTEDPENVGQSNILPTPISYDFEKSGLHQKSRYSDISASTNEAAKVLNTAAFVSGRTIKLGAASSNEDIIVDYYRSPGSFSSSGILSSLKPALSFDIIDVPTLEGTVSEYVINDADSYSFDIPSVFLSEVVNEVAKLVGVQLEESMVYQYGAAEETGKETKQIN